MISGYAYTLASPPPDAITNNFDDIDTVAFDNNL